MNSALETVRDSILGEKMSHELQAALPDHIPVKRFQQVVITAVTKNPELMEADRTSLFIACVECAQDGLVPNGKEAALAIFSTKNKVTGEWVKQVQYMPMISGIYKRAHESGDIPKLSSHVVHENDKFSYEYGFEPSIKHQPALQDRGEIIGVYALAITRSGTREIEYMETKEIESVRHASRNPESGPWEKWWGEMARKTVVRRLCKRLDLSLDMERIVHRDDVMYDLDQQPRAIAGIDKPAPPRPTREDYKEDEATVDRATVIVDAEGIPPDEALSRAKEEADDEARAGEADTVIENLTIHAPIEGDWCLKMEAALRACTTVDAVNDLAKDNEAGMVDYAALHSGEVGSLKALFENKRTELAQAPLGGGTDG